MSTTHTPYNMPERLMCAECWEDWPCGWERGRLHGLEEAAEYMLSRRVTASEFYAREIRSLKEKT